MHSDALPTESGDREGEERLRRQRDFVEQLNDVARGLRSRGVPALCAEVAIDPPEDAGNGLPPFILLDEETGPELELPESSPVSSGKPAASTLQEQLETLNRAPLGKVA